MYTIAMSGKDKCIVIIAVSGKDKCILSQCQVKINVYYRNVR